MTYYRVPEELDQKKYNNGNLFLIKNELYTLKELKRYKLNPAAFEKIEVSKNKIYWLFGARFAPDRGDWKNETI